MVRYHAPRGGGGAKGVYKAAESWLRWLRKHGGNAPASHGVPHRGGFPVHPTGIKGAKQRQHVPGTPEFKQRKQRGQQGSAWNGDERYANEHTYEAWNKGKPVPNRPGKKDHDFGETVGHTADGRPQTKVRVHMDQSGQIHGHPKT
jgi:hypothetical protein